MFGRLKTVSNTQFSGQTTRKQSDMAGPVVYPWQKLRLPAFLITALLTTVAGAWMMYDILSANGLTVFEAILWLFFVATFSWISVAFWSGFIGFVLRLGRRPQSRGLLAGPGHCPSGGLPAGASRYLAPPRGYPSPVRVRRRNRTI